MQENLVGMFLPDIIVLIDSKPRDNHCRERDLQTGLKAGLYAPLKMEPRLRICA